MWAQYASYADVSQGPCPRQLFVTKNEVCVRVYAQVGIRAIRASTCLTMFKVLCREVERSFRNMGLAWRKRGTGAIDVREEDKPKFITSAEWLDRLDVELPGERFFTGVELKQRLDKRKHNDAVTKGIEALLSEENVGGVSDSTSHREEMTFPVFRRLWRKIRSGSGSQIDGTMVWREIKSFIKGSVAALHVDKTTEDRIKPSNRFLSLEEYLALPRKQSRMDETQRREVYDLFLSYEKLKREGNKYDEMDLVYNLAGRIALVDHSYLESKAAAAEEFDLLPIDSLFVDEVQVRACPGRLVPIFVFFRIVLTLDGEHLHRTSRKQSSTSSRSCAKTPTTYSLPETPPRYVTPLVLLWSCFILSQLLIPSRNRALPLASTSDSLMSARFSTTASVVLSPSCFSFRTTTAATLVFYDLRHVWWSFSTTSSALVSTDSHLISACLTGPSLSSWMSETPTSFC